LLTKCDPALHLPWGWGGHGLLADLGNNAAASYLAKNARRTKQRKSIQNRILGGILNEIIS